LIIEKWLDDVFVWSSEHGNLTLEIPFGWYTPKKWNQRGPSKLTLWKRKHRKELHEFKLLTGTGETSRKWMDEKQKELRKLKKSGKIN
jgi:hypothetical protein